MNKGIEGEITPLILLSIHPSPKKFSFGKLLCHFKPRSLTYVSFKEMGRFLGSFTPKQPRFYTLFLTNGRI
jgi:hypothetical protein